METGIFIPDFSDSILVQSKLIEDLNSDIKVKVRLCNPTVT